MKKLKNLIIIFFISFLLVSCETINQDNNNNQNDKINNGGSGVTIQDEYKNKIVYSFNEGDSVENYINHCNLAGGKFNECGSPCGPDEDVCIQVCVYTCEFENGGDNNTGSVNIDNNTDKFEIEKSFSDNESGINGNIIVNTKKTEVTISGKATGDWYFEGQFNIELLDKDGNTIKKQVMADGEWMTEDYVPFKSTINYEELNIDNSIEIIFYKANPSGLPENEFKKTLKINLK